jgi:signal transduction histidine kinase
MRKRLQRAVMSAVVVALAVFVLPLGFGATALLAAAAGQDAERAALEAAFRIGPSFTAGDPIELPQTSGTTVGVYAPSGRLVGGKGPAHLEAGALRARAGIIVQTAGQGVVVAAVPVTANESVIGVVRASSATPIAAESAGVWLALLGAAAVIIAGSAVLARRAGRQLAVPVERLAQSAHEIGEGRLAVLPRSSGIDEVDAAYAALVDAGRRISELVAREQRIASDASHQLRTPLAGLRASLELALAEPEADPRGVLTGALSQVDRLDSTIDGLIALARTSGSNRGPSDPVAVVEERAAYWRSLIQEPHRRLDVLADGDVPAVAVPAFAIATVLDVLLENAVKHGAGDLEIVVRAHDAVVAIDVASSDRYDGPEDPFPDGASRDGGSGLGLGLARRTAADFGGRLLLTETTPRTRFGLLLPVSVESEAAADLLDS